MPLGDELQLPNFLFNPVQRTLAIVGVILVVIGFISISTAFTIIEPGEVGIIKNNLTGAEEIKLTNGTVVHLPFGLTQVYTLDKTQQSIRMTSRSDRGDRSGDDSVQIKTNDGSNVNMDVEVQYQIIPEKADLILKELGQGEKYTQLVRPYSRSIIRDQLGLLSVTEIAEPNRRDEELRKAKQRMNKEFEKYGIKVLLVMATNPVFNPQYEQMIKDRKEADQDVRNELSAQKTAEQDQLRQVAEANKLKKVETRQAQGVLRGRVVKATGIAEKRVALAEGTSEAIVEEAEGTLTALQNEAKALETEGLARAKGIRALADAYEKGGIALVREALAEKFRGVLLEGRPYSLASTIDRFRIEKAAAANREGSSDE